MKRQILVFISIFSIFYSSAQLIISNDTSFCTSQPHDLYAISSETSFMQVDDQHDSIRSLGFDFDFYGNTYDRCVISGNGYITFDTTVANTASPWIINAAIPNPGQMPENAIMAPWHDIDLNIGGNITFGTAGAAPNRMFIVTFCAIPMYEPITTPPNNCNSLLHTSQVILHEGSNKIEMFIQDKPICLLHNSGHAVQGLVDATSTNADIVTDPVSGLPRNWSVIPTPWTATNEGWEFLPNGITSYNINSIAYQPIIAGVAVWWDNAGNSWPNGGSTISVNPSSTTTYYCSVSGSCVGTMTDSVTISIIGCIDITLTSTPSSCLGTDGTISVTPDLSTTSPPWLIELQDMNGINVQVANNVMTTTHIFSNVVTGSYIVKVTTQSNNDSDQDTIVVSQILNPLSVATNYQDINCYGGSDGSISVVPNGGALPYEFFINGVLNTNSPPTDSVFTNLFPGTYVMSVIDANNCMDKDTVIITHPNYPLQVSPSSKSLNCYGANTGFATVSSVGGTPSYSYEWFDGSNYSIGTGDSIYGLVGGSYFVKVTDTNGCEDIGTTQILQSQTPLVGQNQQFAVACKGDNSGMIVSQATGSQGPYKYYWFDSAGDSILTSSTDSLKMGRDTLSALFSGTYNLHLYDANGCSDTTYSITIGEPATALSIDNVVVSNTIACYGDNDGGAQTYFSGGMPNYYFSWDNGESNSNAVNLDYGYHVVTLTDDWNCTVKDSVFISENPKIRTTILVDNEVSCYGLSDGSVSASSVGGLPNYTYFWSNGYTQTGTTTTNSGLSYGSYYLTTQDILGCNVVDTILVEQPNPLYVEATEIDRISCYGDSNGVAYAYGWGGTEPYTFYWDSLSSASGDTNSMLSPGVHTVYIVDSRGCESTDTVFTHEPPVFEVNIIDSLTILPYCIGVNTASLTSLVNGGTPPYWYEWDDNPVTPQTTPVATNLLAGVYTITVTDYRGCIVSDTRDIDMVTGSITATIHDPITYNGYHVSCFGDNDGMLYVEGGGTIHTPFTYQWYGPNGFSSINDSITNLVAGTYSVTLMDSNDCIVNTSFNITTPEFFEYKTTGVLRNESCDGACNGQLSIELEGGTPPYVGTSTDQSSGTVINSTMIGVSILDSICSGVWDVVLTDANGCNSSLMPGGTSRDTVIFNDTIFSAVTSVDTILCYGTNTGSIYVSNPNPNITNYAYNWVNASTGTSVGTGDTINNIPSGTYVLEAQYMDSLSFSLPYDGCTTRDTIEITQIDEILIQAVIRDVDCYDNDNGRISVHPNNGGSVSGGTPTNSGSGYSYTWNPTGTGNGRTVNNLTEGTYTLSVTDAHGCLKVDTFVVTEPDVLVSNVTQIGATLTVNVIGGTTNYSYSWRETLNPTQHLQGGTDYMVLVAGTYYCVVTDANACETTSNSFTYTSPNNPTSIDESEISLKIYPNPFRERTTIDFGRVMIDGDLKVIDILGNVVDVYELKNQRELVIEKGTKSKGVYFVELKINNRKIFKKITLQ